VTTGKAIEQAILQASGTGRRLGPATGPWTVMQMHR
jgi:hypothetical protein